MLLDSNGFADQFKSSLAGVQTRLIVASAFIKEAAIRKALIGLSDKVDVSVVARWQARDIVFGASDLDVYEFCRERGYQFGINLDFHGKLYIFDGKDILLGSANLTGRGFGQLAGGNLEFGTKIEAQDADGYRIDEFLSKEVVWLDEMLYSKIRADLSRMTTAKLDSAESISWSDAVLQEFRRPVNYLWVEELPFHTPAQLLLPDLNDETYVHDLELLGIDIDNLTTEALVAAFIKTRVFTWLVRVISEAPRTNFGSLTAALHSSLLDDPTPYRKDVKALVATIFSWLELLNETFDMTNHARTTSVRLK